VTVNQGDTCLGLGSNVQPEINLPRAVELLRQILKITAVSTAWESPAVGMTGPPFLNAAVLVDTDTPIDELKLHLLRPIESSLGRVRTENKYAARPIDIDVLIHQGEILEPLIWEQPYLAVPVAELLPNLHHPQTGEFLQQVADRLRIDYPIYPHPQVLPGSS